MHGKMNVELNLLVSTFPQSLQWRDISLKLAFLPMYQPRR